MLMQVEKREVTDSDVFTEVEAQTDDRFKGLGLYFDEPVERWNLVHERSKTRLSNMGFVTKEIAEQLATEIGPKIDWSQCMYEIIDHQFDVMFKEVCPAIRKAEKANGSESAA